MSDNLKPLMSDAKIQLLSNSLDRASHYLEYGMGESTLLAAAKSLLSIVSIDTSEEWISKVHASLEKSKHKGNIHLLHTNLGKTLDWGYPVNELFVKSWPSYYTSPWIEYRNLCSSPDLILIDGRFRSPCFLYSILHCKAGTRILWDDYLNRTEYHFVEKVLPPQGLIDDMAIFTVNENIDKQLASILLFENLFNLD
jgi:hypothetical protein